MKMKNPFSFFSDAFSQKRICGRKKLTASYLSIFLVFMLLISSTLAWFTVNDTADISSDTFTMESVSGLRVNDGEDLKNHISIENLLLSEASSVDGRNMYFPTTGTFTNNTSEMVFREGNAGDKNENYCYEEFNLKGDSGVTYVYIKSYSVTVDRKQGDQTVSEVFDGSTKITYDSNGIPIAQEKHAECPVRISFIGDSSETPIVLDPSALINNYATDYNAVASIDENGKASTMKSEASSFSDYYYATGKPIFTLVGSQPLTVAMVVWLEGTSEACDQYAGQKISIDIELESNWTNMDYITFVDDTLPDDGGGQTHWINNNNDCFVVMTYRDVNADNAMKSVVMKQEDTYEWMAPIPDNITTGISFYRYSLNEEVIYNAWHTFEGVDGQLSPTADAWAKDILGENKLQEYRTSDGTSGGTIERVYTARRGNGYGLVSDNDPELQKKRLSPCIGYWGTPSTVPETTAATTAPSGETTTTSPTTPQGTVTISVSLGQIKPWVQGNLENDGYELYIEFSDGSLVKMDRVSADYYENKAVTAKLNTTVKSFTLKSASNTKFLPLESPVLITSNRNMSFQMTNNDTVIRTG